MRPLNRRIDVDGLRLREIGVRLFLHHDWKCPDMHVLKIGQSGPGPHPHSLCPELACLRDSDLGDQLPALQLFVLGLIEADNLDAGVVDQELFGIFQIRSGESQNSIRSPLNAARLKVRQTGAPPPSVMAPATPTARRQLIEARQ